MVCNWKWNYIPPNNKDFFSFFHSHEKRWQSQEHTFWHLYREEKSHIYCCSSYIFFGLFKSVTRFVFVSLAKFIQALFSLDFWRLVLNKLLHDKIEFWKLQLLYHALIYWCFTWLFLSIGNYNFPIKQHVVIFLYL